jgi:hypothetical protein
MITIAQHVDEYIRNSPFLEEALVRGILNLSALAREMRPRLQAELGKEVSPAAILMALKRLTPVLLARVGAKPARLKEPGDLIVRSNLVEYTFRRSDSLWEKQKRLLLRIERDPEAFLTFTQGVFEVMLIASRSIEKAVQEIFARENILSHRRNLSAVIIRLSPRAVHVPGVYYSILKQLAWGNLNVIDVVSTTTEFTILLEKSQVEDAFSILKRYLWP